MDAYNDSKGDVLEILHNTTHNLFPEVFFDHDPRSLKDEPDNDDLMTKDKVFHPGIWEKIFSPSIVRLSSKDRHCLSFTIVIQILLTYPVNFLLSSGNEDTIFDTGIFAFYFSSLELVAFESQMEVRILQKSQEKSQKPGKNEHETERVHKSGNLSSKGKRHQSLSTRRTRVSKETHQQSEFYTKTNGKEAHFVPNDWIATLAIHVLSSHPTATIHDPMIGLRWMDKIKAARERLKDIEASLLAYKRSLNLTHRRYLGVV
ncbi:hypothetical protein Tco_0528838 [Tanacetum coccineum]